MTTPFVWFDNIGSDRTKTTEFLSKTFDWALNDIGPMAFLTDGDAKDDLIGIHQYGVRKHGEVQADACFWQIIERLEVLGETPLLYQEVPEIRVGYRRSVCGEHSIYYCLDGENVEIMAILRSQNATLGSSPAECRIGR